MNKFFSKFADFKLKFSIKMSLRFLLTIFVYCAILVVLLLFSISFITSFVWYANDPLYQVLNFIAEYIIVFLLLALAVGIVVIFIYYFYKVLNYINLVVLATEKIYDHKYAYIQLPPDLKELELQFNQVKTKVNENEKIAKEAEQRKNDLIVYLAHDLKTPLTSVIGYLTLLKDEPQISPQLQEKYLSIALQKSERLETLISEFFEITRFNLSHIPLEIATINLTRMLEQLTFEFKPIFENKNLSYKLDIAPDVFIKCDINKFQRVLDNLLRNAVNYSFENTTVEINVTQNNLSTDFVFSNHGKSIPTEKLDRIFDQFYRLDSSRSSADGGAGLGLAIAKEIIVLHKGSITAESQNETITIKISIPRL